MFRRLFRLAPRTRAAVHAEIDEELDALIAARVEDLVARGLTYEDARAEAARRLGANLDHVRTQLHKSARLRERRMRLDELFDDLWHDVRYAVRGLRRRPAFTTVAVLTLAIGIGATTAIFSAVNTMILRPLPYARPHEIMRINLETPAIGGRPPITAMVWSYPKAQQFRARQAMFSDIAAYAWQPLTITSGEPELARIEFVTASYLRFLGLTPAMGRDFDLSIDAQFGAEPQVIISDALWQRRFNADRTVIGQKISFERQPYTIVGVAPPGFLGLTGEAQAFIPIATQAAADNGAQSHWLNLIGRRRPGLTDAQINAAMRLLGREVNEVFPDEFTAGKPWSGNAHPLDESRVSPLVKRSLFVLLGAVAFVLLIACVNVANLLIGRASARRREIAVRLAIGAGRARLVRLLLTESTVLALAGAVASVAIAWFGVRALSAVNPATLRLPRFVTVGSVTFSSIALDWTALAFALGLALVIGLVFGLVPALHATRSSLTEAMKEGAGFDRGGRSSVGRRALVVVEVALALVLLVGSGLMMRSLSKLLAVDPGFDTRNVLTLRLTVPDGGLARDSLPGFYTQLLERVRAVPGVTHAALGACAPLSGPCSETFINLLDRPEVPVPQRPLVEVNFTSSDWFATGRVPLKSGRVFDHTDRLESPKVIVINETAAKRFWPNQNPVGKRASIGLGALVNGADIIGVVGDVRQAADSAAMPRAYVSVNQAPRTAMMIFVRASRDAAALGPDVRRAIREIAPAYPIHDMQTLADRAAGATAQARFSAVLLGLFAATALSLAVVGIYGVMSLVVTARTREIGIRMALGADQGRVRRAVVREGVGLVAVGAVLGLVGALLSTRVLQSLLFELTPSDPATYVTILIVLSAAAVAASWIPARRASRVDPVEALRAD
jgi:putative ABC transport system permease protein